MSDWGKSVRIASLIDSWRCNYYISVGAENVGRAESGGSFGPPGLRSLSSGASSVRNWELYGGLIGKGNR